MDNKYCRIQEVNSPTVYPKFPQMPKRQSLINFTPSRKVFYTPEIDFNLSDSEYGSLKNEKSFNHSKTSIVRKICDSTTDIPSIKHLKEVSPEPKISTTYYTPNYMQENRSIPFKKRYIMKLQETDNLIIKKPPILNVSNNRNSSHTGLSYTSSSSSISQANDKTQYEDLSESITKVKSWNADFETAYNNDMRINEQGLKTINIHSGKMSIDNQGCNYQSITCHGTTKHHNLESPPIQAKKLKSNNFSLATSYSGKSSSNMKRYRKKIKFADTPLSPETTKRNEFYSYLQLNVKPQFRSDGTPLEPSRRSVRVKNIEINKERDRSISEEIKPEKSNPPEILKSKIEENGFNEIGFSVVDKETSLKSESMLLLAKNEIDKSLEQFNNLRALICKNDVDDNKNKVEKKLEKKILVKKKSRDESDTVLNHINGPVTRHSFAVIHKTLTRGSHTKLPKLNLDAVMKRMYNKHKPSKIIVPKVRSKSCSLAQNTEIITNIESRLENISIRRENVSNLLNAVNNEVLKVQNNILELSSQNSCYEDDFSECSKVSEHSFRGFGTPLNGGTSSSGTTSVSYSEVSSSHNDKCGIRSQRRYSLPTYISNERELKLNDLISPDLPIKSSPICTNDNNLVCHHNSVEDLLNSSMQIEESSPKFIPLSPHPVRPFHQIFNKRIQKQQTNNAPCIFGSETNVLYSNFFSEEWNMVNNSSNNYSEYIPILRQTIQDKLNIKQNKILMPHINKSEQHVVDISNDGGQVLSVHFLNSTLMIVQDKCISFWQQTPLGYMLGAQNMWLSLGKIQRLNFEVGYVNIRCVSQSCLSSDNATAFIELWAKEHKSERRERPITDVFAVVYFHQQTKKGNILDKKVIQLENTKSFAQDVQFVCLKYGRSIIISWRDQFASPPKSQIRRYQLAVDFQTISNVMEMESVEHYVSELHDVNECFEMILGIGDHQVSIWHLLQGKLVTTVTIHNPLPIHEQINGNQYYDINCVWALCDRGFLFLINKTDNNVLHLIAINGLRKDWKNLQKYKIPADHTEIQSVGINGGVLLACSKKGIVCWSLQSGAMLIQCPTGSNISLYPSDTYISLIDQHLNVAIKNIFAFLLED
ncbi:uncharacterized protein LOC123296125 [Chrysoperla carnea]|uniref:uncharacterized protein LOC123296125 n=1 Tax=Chrysoperla carnea TaxID=189513 RepID=UPI001D083D00|nr:uncharacterized protein LOC123296125 [Chrysoperla carnea]